jgi:hypothetical protein
VASSAAAVRRAFAVSDTHIRVLALTSHLSEANAEDATVGMGAGQDRLTGDAGLVVVLSHRVRLGATYRQGVSW